MIPPAPPPPEPVKSPTVLPEPPPAIHSMSAAKVVTEIPRVPLALNVRY